SRSAPAPEHSPVKKPTPHNTACSQPASSGTAPNCGPKQLLASAKPGGTGDGHSENRAAGPSRGHLAALFGFSSVSYAELKGFRAFMPNSHREVIDDSVPIACDLPGTVAAECRSRRVRRLAADRSANHGPDRAP